jgi:hypothetical protein
VKPENIYRPAMTVLDGKQGFFTLGIQIRAG